jgi:hypothetical protein
MQIIFGLAVVLASMRSALMDACMSKIIRSVSMMPFGHGAHAVARARTAAPRFSAESLGTCSCKARAAQPRKLAMIIHGTAHSFMQLRHTCGSV